MASPRSEEERRKALESARREFSVLSRRVNSGNSSPNYVRDVHKFQDSLDRGHPDMKLANYLAAYVMHRNVKSAADIQKSIEHEKEFAAKHPGYEAHGYATTIQDSYDIADSVRHKTVFEYGGNLPGNVAVFTAKDHKVQASAHPSRTRRRGLRQGALEDRVR